jgi:hypothetical protein
MKIAINVSKYGKFQISGKALHLYNTYTEAGVLDGRTIERNDPVLIRVLEEIGPEEAGGFYTQVKIIEIPDDVDWYIDDDGYGREFVREKHRSWKDNEEAKEKTPSELYRLCKEEIKDAKQGMCANGYSVHFYVERMVDLIFNSLYEFRNLSHNEVRVIVEMAETYEEAGKMVNQYNESKRKAYVSGY